MEKNATMQGFVPKHEFLVCIDSDGCAFDTMELKQKECFCCATILVWGLQPVSKYAREAWEHVNLYSKSRGCSRFHAILRAFDLLARRPEVAARGFTVPDIGPLRRWVERAPVLNNEALAREADATGDMVLRRALEWSHEMNRRAAEMVRGVPPFPLVKDCLKRLRGRADVVVVSATPREALLREWHEHGLDDYIACIGAQEDGGKREMIAAIQGGYAPGRAVMIGDAPGDYAAARANGILFYPILPGGEEASWRAFHDTVLEQFLAGEYAGAEMARQLERFDRCLPDNPPWQSGP